jgi:hypothetical protein
LFRGFDTPLGISSLEIASGEMGFGCAQDKPG